MQVETRSGCSSHHTPSSKARDMRRLGGEAIPHQSLRLFFFLLFGFSKALKTDFAGSTSFRATGIGTDSFVFAE